MGKLTVTIIKEVIKSGAGVKNLSTQLICAVKKEYKDGLVQELIDDIIWNDEASFQDEAIDMLGLLHLKLYINEFIKIKDILGEKDRNYLKNLLEEIAEKYMGSERKTRSNVKFNEEEIKAIADFLESEKELVEKIKRKNRQEKVVALSEKIYAQKNPKELMQDLKRDMFDEKKKNQAKDILSFLIGSGRSYLIEREGLNTEKLLELYVDLYNEKKIHVIPFVGKNEFEVDMDELSIRNNVDYKKVLSAVEGENEKQQIEEYFRFKKYESMKEEGEILYQKEAQRNREKEAKKRMMMIAETFKDGNIKGVFKRGNDGPYHIDLTDSEYQEIMRVKDIFRTYNGCESHIVKRKMKPAFKKEEALKFIKDTMKIVNRFKKEINIDDDLLIKTYEIAKVIAKECEGKKTYKQVDFLEEYKEFSVYAELKRGIPVSEEEVCSIQTLVRVITKGKESFSKTYILENFGIAAKVYGIPMSDANNEKTRELLRILGDEYSWGFFKVYYYEMTKEVEKYTTENVKDAAKAKILKSVLGI